MINDRQLSSNKVAGDWIVERHSINGRFFKPGTLWDGCFARPFVNATSVVPSAPRTWWTIQNEIKATRDNIHKQMDLFAAYDTCRANAATAFDNEKKAKDLTTATLSNQLLTDAEYATGYLLNVKIPGLQAAFDKLTGELASQTTLSLELQAKYKQAEAQFPGLYATWGLEETARIAYDKAGVDEACSKQAISAFESLVLSSGGDSVKMGETLGAGIAALKVSFGVASTSLATALTDYSAALTQLNSLDYDLIQKIAAAKFGDPKEQEAATRSQTAAQDAFNTAKTAFSVKKTAYDQAAADYGSACVLNKQQTELLPVYVSWKQQNDLALKSLESLKAGLAWVEPVNPTKSIMDTLKNFQPATNAADNITWFKNSGLTTGVNLAYAIYSLNADSASGFSSKISVLQAAINGKIAEEKDTSQKAYDAAKKAAEDIYKASVPAQQTVTDAKAAYDE